jgi:hypothetical protein
MAGAAAVPDFLSYAKEADLDERGAILISCMEQLHSGAILCRLLNRLWPASVPPALPLRAPAGAMFRGT